MTITDIAEVVHNIQRVFCESIGETLPTWDNADRSMRKTTTQGVADLVYRPDAVLDFPMKDGCITRLARAMYGAR